VIFPVDGQSHFSYTNQSDLVLDNVSDVGLDSAASNQLKQELLPYLIKVKAQLGKKIPVSLKELINVTEASWSSWASVQVRLDRFVKTTKITHDIPAKFLDSDLVSKLITPDAFAKRWQPMQTDLAQGLKKEREVYVSGVYYALESEAYGDYIAAAFKVPVQSESQTRSWF
jgi:hypothetical protein